MLSSIESSRGYIYFRSNFQQIEANIINDGLLNESKKNDFFIFLSNYKGLEEKTPFKNDCCYNFFYKNQFLGRKHSFKCKFGHVATSEELKTAFRKIAKTSPFRSSRTLSREKSLDDFLELTNGILDIDDIKKKLVAPFRPYTIWIFKDPDDLPFKNKKYLNEEMRSLLGLGHLNENDDLYGLTIDVSSINEIFSPTLFDGEFNEFWRPGGFTLVLKDIFNFSKDSDGLEEYIAQGKLIGWDIVDKEIIRLN